MGLASVSTYEKQPSITVLFLPGQFDNAYQQRLNHSLLYQASLAEYGCVLANSRGQDYCSYQRKYGADFANEYSWVRIGSSFERVRDAHYDVSAWIDLISEIAPGSRLALAGHSHGAIKVANYMIEEKESRRERVAAIVLLSPSDDIGSRKAKLGTRYDEAVMIAKAHVEEGKPDALMPEWTVSAPLSAGTYYEAFGPESPLRTFAFHSPEISPLSESQAGWIQPSLVIFGSNDGATGSASSDEACAISKNLLSRSKACETVVIENTDHHYRGSEDAVAKAVVDWLNKH